MDTLEVWHEIKRKAKEKYRDVRNLLKDKIKLINIKNIVEHKQFRRITIISITFILSISSLVYYNKGFSQEINLNGENIGYVKKLDMVDEALELVELHIRQDHGDKAFFQSEITSQKVRGHKKDIIKTEELAENMKSLIEVYKPATILKVDGEEILILESESMVEALLEEAKSPYIMEEVEASIEVVDFYIKEDIEFEERDVLVKNILSLEEAKSILGINQEEDETYFASRDRAMGKVSRALGNRRRQENTSQALEEEDEENSEPASLLNIIRVEKHTNIKEISFKEEEVKDSSLYKGQKKVKEKGKKGKKEVISELIYSNGKEISKEILDEVVIEEPVNKVTLIGTKSRPQPKPAPTYNGELGSSIVATARHYLGTPYRSGGSSPAGFDCSGFTSYVYKQYGVNLPRTTSGQLAYGGRISKSELKPGDLVFFTRHVGIYIGNGNMIHSPVPGKRVEITSIYNAYFKSRYKGATRPY